MPDQDRTTVSVPEVMIIRRKSSMRRMIPMLLFSLRQER